MDFNNVKIGAINVPKKEKINQDDLILLSNILLDSYSKYIKKQKKLSDSKINKKKWL